MSIGDLYIFTRIVLSMLTIYENRFLCYNRAIIEKVSLFYGTPGEENVWLCLNRNRRPFTSM